LEILGDLTSSHGKYLPMLPKLKKIALLAGPFLGSRLTASPYYGISDEYRSWGRAVLVGLFEALYKRSRIPGVTAIEGLDVTGIDSRTLFITPTIVARTKNGMEQLKTESRAGQRRS